MQPLSDEQKTEILMAAGRVISEQIGAAASVLIVVMDEHGRVSAAKRNFTPLFSLCVIEGMRRLACDPAAEAVPPSAARH